jgi:hypothetical protein
MQVVKLSGYGHVVYSKRSTERTLRKESGLYEGFIFKLAYFLLRLLTSETPVYVTAFRHKEVSLTVMKITSNLDYLC